MCREHGQQLSKLAADQQLDGFQLFGVVKETGVDDEGLKEFHNTYYPYPLYRDESLTFYESLGKNSIFKNLSWNPFEIYKDAMAVGERMKEKNIEGNFIGEGLKTGGIFIFGKDGTPKYAYPEDTGTPIVEEDVLMAVREVRESSKVARTSEL